MSENVKIACVLLDEARKTLGCKENKGTPNRSPCVDAIHRDFDGNVTATAWCAETVYVWYKRACRRLGIKNNLVPKEAGAANFLNGCKAMGYNVGNTPLIGNPFYKKPAVKGSSGHLGIVESVDLNGFTTISGNSDDMVKRDYYKTADIERLGFDFIEVLRIPDGRELLNCPKLINSADDSSTIDWTKTLFFTLFLCSTIYFLSNSK